MENCVTIIFSKDRALQLEATMRSYLNLCTDGNTFPISILFFASNDFYRQQYEKLIRGFKRFEFINFIPEEDFRKDLIALLAPYDYVLFLTDDNIFVRKFNLQTILNSLENISDALGFSLRLGYNTTYCYPLDKMQKLPKFEALGLHILKYTWVDAEYDFGYPLELSSSVYRTEDIVPFIARLPFKNPNTLESVMADNSHQFHHRRPALLCFENSVTFCAPINMVQTMWKNRAGNKEEYNAENLARLFEQGFRIDVKMFEGFTPNACHQEIELKFTRDSRENPPLVSVIIPCYNLAQYLPEAVESVVKQTFTDWECIIVNDGSTDDTSEVARKIISKYSDRRIILLEKENGGPADARNFGIMNSQGVYILPLDADDVIHPSFLEKALNVLLKNPNIHIIYTDLQEFGERNNYVSARDFNPISLRFQNHLNYCSLYLRKVWTIVGGYDTKKNIIGYEDWDFWIGCAEKGFTAQRIPEPLLLYRIRKVSTYTQAIKRDLEKKAHIVLNHPSLYSESHIIWAKAVLNGEEWVKSISNVIGVIPTSIPPTVLAHRKDLQLTLNSQTTSTNTPKVSVIVPTVNRPKMLKNAVQSILGQTFQDFEIIVVNDAGENVGSIIQSFNDRRIQYISHLQNKGLAATRNTGIRNAKGKYIAYLDDDDVFLPNHLETLVRFLEGNPEFKVAYTDAFRVHQNKINGDYVPVARDLPYSRDFDPVEILFGNYIPVLCILHHKKILDEIGLFDETLTTHEDWDLWIRISRKYPFYHIKQVTCEFSWREDGSTMTSSIREDFFRTMKIIYAKNKPLVQEEIEKAISDGNLELAERIVTKMMSTFVPQNHPEPLIDLGVIRSLQSRYNEAIQIFQKVLELHPNNEIANENLKILLQKV